jgi:hypothetical protein
VQVSRIPGAIIGALIVGLALHYGADLSNGRIVGFSLLGGALGYMIGHIVGDCIHFVRNGRDEDLLES